MSETITFRLNAHLEAAGAALAELATVAAIQPSTALRRLPLLDRPIQVGPFVTEWHRLLAKAYAPDADRAELFGAEWHQLFARAGARIDVLTTIYRDLARTMQRTSGIRTALHSYVVPETARRRLLPFPAAGRPRVTPEAGLFLAALHNLFWLVCNHAMLPRQANEDPLPAAAADLVLTPLQTVAEADNLDVGDVMLITELSRWAADLLSGTRDRTATVLFGLVGGEDGPASAVPGAGARDRADAWLAAAVAAFRPEFAERGYELPDVAVFARRPQRHRRLSWRRPIGTARWQGSGTRPVEILVDPQITHPVDVLAVLKHELLHAALYAANPGHGHGRQFRESAAALGMQPRRSTKWTVAGRADAVEIAERLGPYPAPPVPAETPRRWGRGWIVAWLRRRHAPAVDTGPVSDLLPLPEALQPSLLALRTLSPIARFETAAEGVTCFTAWQDRWPGLRPLLEGPDALTVRQELTSRLGLRLATPNLGDDRLAAVLGILGTLDGMPRLSREPWFDFVASLLLATLGAMVQEPDRDALDWKRWTHEAGGHRSLAYWTGRVARAAEDLAATRDVHEYPKLVWRWREIARTALVPWLDARGLPALCLSHWLEGLLEADGGAPPLIVTRRVCGFGVADVVDLWRRAGKANSKLSLVLDTGAPVAFRAALASSRRRLRVLPAMRRQIRETRHFDMRPHALAAPAVERPKLAEIVRYATEVPPISPHEPLAPQPDAARAPSTLDQVVNAIERTPPSRPPTPPNKPSVPGGSPSGGGTSRRRRLGTPDPRGS